MHNRNIVRIFILCLLPGLLSVVSLEAAAFGVKVSPPRKAHNSGNRPWGNFEAAKPGLNKSPSARPDARYPGAAPGTGWYPAQLPGARGPATNVEPVVEVSTQESVLYEQQNVVYTVRVVSKGSLKTLNPVIPRIEGAILDQVDGPVASTRYSRQSNNLEIINEYHFKLTPLRAGEIVIPPIGFKGTHVETTPLYGSQRKPAGNTANKFSISADSPLKLQVLPAEPAVTPWLPLNDLKLRVHLLEAAPAKAGVPVTLSLELIARGALGSQLPSLQQQLKSDDFRVYRDSVDTRNEVSIGGLELRGSRKENYTIIPLQDGWIQLPEIQLAWWDVDTQAPMLARYAIQSAVPRGRGAEAASGTPAFTAAIFWAPLLIFAALVAAYWLRAWARTRPYLQALGNRARNWLSATARRGMQHAAVLGKHLVPAVSLSKLRLLVAMLMPKSVKLWMCARCVDSEDRPEAWCVQFRSRVCPQLDISQHAPITSIVEKIIETQPHAEPARLRALARSMEQAVYGSGVLDFAAWKQDFRYQLRPRLYRRRQSLLQRASRALPALNPHS
jgi:hypothetical protein